MKILLLIPVLFLYLSLKSQSVNRVELSNDLDETSALLFFNGYFWTLNDSGGENAIYQIDNSGTLLHKTILENSVNIDWEALAQSEKYFLVGDVGNNYGNRQNLKIYFLNKSDVIQDRAPISGVIEYKYEKQLKYIKNRSTEFDCEAVLVKDSVILLFTKDWKYRKGALYTLPLKSGSFTAKYIQSLDEKGLVTDASWLNDTIYLSGYYDFVPVIWKYLYMPTSKLKFISRKEFPQMFRWQVEGIVASDSIIYLTSEKSAINQSLIKMTTFRE